MAGGPVQEEKARPGGPVQNIFDVGGGGHTGFSAWSGRDILELSHLHYARDTISLSTFLCITRHTFYFASGE
jgi:hypothetical protein